MILIIFSRFLPSVLGRYVAATLQVFAGSLTDLFTHLSYFVFFSCLNNLNAFYITGNIILAHSPYMHKLFPHMYSLFTRKN
jgi:hypothetical protein